MACRQCSYEIPPLPPGRYTVTLAGLEQVRAIFDAGEIGVILIGMPGLMAAVE